MIESAQLSATSSNVERRDASKGRLSALESASFVRVVEAALQLETEEEFIHWAAHDLQTILPHGMLLCGIGSVDAGTIHLRRIVSCNVPPEFAAMICRGEGGILSQIIADWCRDFRPKLYTFKGDTERVSRLDPLGRYCLQNLAVHGMRDLGSNMVSYFQFSRLTCRLDVSLAYLLELLVPYMHLALSRSLITRTDVIQATRETATLTARELEVMRWLRAGKTNWEIAQILGTSAHTVKNQVRGLLVKLQVRNRAQAVAKSLSPEMQ